MTLADLGNLGCHHDAPTHTREIVIKTQRWARSYPRLRIEIMQNIYSNPNRISDRKQYDTALDSWKWKHLLVISEPEKSSQEKCKILGSEWNGKSELPWVQLNGAYRGGQLCKAFARKAVRSRKGETERKVLIYPCLWEGAKWNKLWKWQEN